MGAGDGWLGTGAPGGAARRAIGVAFPSPQPRVPSPQGGYTLLEVMLALMIMGAASALVVVNMPAPEPTLQHEANVLTARLIEASQEAIGSGLPIGADFDDKGYRFRRRVARDWRLVTDDPALAPRAWPEGVEVEVLREGEAVDAEAAARKPLPPASMLDVTTAAARPAPPPVLRFDTTGAATELSLVLSGRTGSYRVGVAVDGKVTLAKGEGR